QSGGSCPYVIRTGDRAGQTCGRLHTQHRCFSRLDDAWRVEFGDDVELPRWADLLKSRIAIFDLDFDAILFTMYALSVSAEGDCYRCLPPDPGIAAAALGASESGTLPGTAPAEALHTFTLDSGASRCFFRLHLPSFSTNLVSTAALQDAMVTTTTPGGQRVSICMCTRTGSHLAPFTRRPGSSLYTLGTEPSQVATSAEVSASGQVAASCSCRLLSHQTLLWHNRLGHPSLPRLRGMHSRLLVSGLPRSLPPLPPSPGQPCLPYVEGRQRAAPHSSSFPPTTAPLQTLHMDVWGPARVSELSRERYFLLVVDVYTRYTMVFPLRSKGQDLPVLRLHSDRGGEFSSDLLRDFCHGEGILQSLAFSSLLLSGGDSLTRARGAAATHPGGARTRGTGAGGTSGVEGGGVVGPVAGGTGAAGAGVGGTGAGGTGAVDPCAGGAGGTVRPQPYFVPLLQQSQPPLQPASPLPSPSPYTVQSGGLTERREPASLPVLPVCTARRAPRSRPPPVPSTHAMALRPSSVPQRVPLPGPPESSLPEVPDPESDRARAANPTVSCLLATAVIYPSFESAAASALVAGLLDFAAACRID
ncbi:unnamed protein product, partial [Closterium sp. NIES-54]